MWCVRGSFLRPRDSWGRAGVERSRPSVLVSLSPRAIILGMGERGPHVSCTRWELWISEGVRRLTET